MREIEYIAPERIEARSFEIIEQELSQRGIALSEPTEMIIKRVIHTSADFDYVDTMCFSPGAVEKAAYLIRGGADIVTDTQMAMSGINKKELSKYGGEVHCFMADPDVAVSAQSQGITRAAVSVKKALGIKKPLIFAVGNAPTALLTLHDSIVYGGRHPEFVIGVPVGFVNVIESKELIMETGIPYIVNSGRKGGSNIAAAIVNAILYEMKKGKL